MPKPDPLARELVRLALELRRATPWRRVPADLPILVRHAGDAHPLAVALAGANRAEPGLTVVRGEDSLQEMVEWLGPRPPSLVGPQPDVVILGYAPLAKIPRELLRIVEEGGLQARREAVVPKVFAVDHSVVPRPPSRGQARSLVAALRAVSIAERDGRLRPGAHAEPGVRILELTLEGHGKRARVAGRSVPWPQPRSRRPAPLAATPPRKWIARLKDLPRLDETWVVGTMNFSVSVVGEERILVPLTVVDVDSHLILASEIVSAGVTSELLAALDAVFRGRAEAPSPEEKRYGLPRAIVFVDPWYLDVLGEALTRIGIQVSVEPDDPVFADVLARFGEALAQGALEEKWS